MMRRLLLTLALACVWGTTAYMSICGLVAVFGGHAVVTISLASGMELAKLMLIIELHRSWRHMRAAARCFYLALVAVLVVATAIESIGYLIDSHTRATATITVDRARLDGLRSQERALRQRIGVIDSTLSQLPAGYVSRRIAEREAAGYARLQADLADILAEQSALAVTVAKSESAASPVVTIARLTGIGHAEVMLAFVLALVFIIEPLTIGLSVATSAAWRRSSIQPGESMVVASDASATEVSGATAETAEKTATDAAETAKTAETAQTAAETAKDPGRAAIVENIEFSEIVRRHNLKTADIATITGRRKFETVVSWLKGDQQIPEKALRELRRWSTAQPAIRLVTR